LLLNRMVTAQKCERFLTLPDFVITDIAMQGVDGNKLARYIRNSSRSELPIVAITGATGDIDEGLFNSILVKPYRLRTLAEKIASFTQGSI